MRYGRFDDKHREYVIENPDTPMSWVNYLGTGDYGGIISNNAAGYAFHKSAKTGRLLRFRFNSLPADRPGRYIYIRDNASGAYWSAAWQPVARPLAKHKTVCRHGLGYTRFLGRYAGIRTDYRVFVPIGKPVEFWEITVENATRRPRDLSLFAYAEWCFWDMNQDLTNFQYILYTCRMAYADDTVDYSIRLWPFSEPKAFMTSILPVESFDTDRDVFIGQYRHEGQPKAVEAGRCFGSIAVGGSPCAALQNRFTLAPGEKKRALFIVGVGDAKTVGQECRRRYADPAAVEEEFARLREYWRGRLGRFACKTPSAEVNSMVNVWNQYQCHTTFTWSRSASFNEAGGRDGLGFRDSTQDTLGVVHAIPERVRTRLVELLKGQHASGAAMHGLQPLTWRQGPHNVERWIFSDDHLWPVLAVAAYLKETGDFAFLDETVPFADVGEAAVYEHLKRALEFSWSQRGPHGICLGLAADWNDCLNLRGRGESMFSTFLFYRGLAEMVRLAERLGRKEEAAHFGAQAGELKANIDKHAWDGEWFLRGFLDSGRPLGGKASDQAKIFINSQTWAVLSGAADREKAVRCMDSLHEHLATEHGVVKNWPAFREHDAEIGAITSFPPGLKENAGIFCHANTWAVAAEGMLGRGDHAFKLYRAFLPAAKNESADVYTMEPYVYSQFITGREHPYKFGRARNSWLTGAASWAFVAASQYILGVRPDYEGLVIEPAIPSEWDGYEVRRVFRGATYRIRVRNPEHRTSGVKRLKVNGKAVPGNLVPIALAGADVKVEAIM
jgi:N,N'-diacetylchitobiose phosphorylase